MRRSLYGRGSSRVNEVKVTIVVPRRLPTLNELRGKYKHFMAYKRLRDGWEKDIAILKRGQMFTGRALVRITSFRKREVDTDGLYGGAKPVIDVLTRLRLIVDDSPQWIDLTVTQEHSGVEETRIEIEPIG